MGGAGQVEQVLGTAAVGVVEVAAVLRVVGPVGVTLDGEHRRAAGWEVRATRHADLSAGHDDGRRDPRVPAAGVVSDRRGRDPAVGVAGDADPLWVDEPGQRPRLGIGRQQPIDHEPDVCRLVDDVVLVRTAWRARVGERKRGRGHHVPGPGPGLQQPGVGGRRDVVAVGEDDEGERSARRRRVPHRRREHPRARPRPTAGVHQGQRQLGHGHRTRRRGWGCGGRRWSRWRRGRWWARRDGGSGWARRVGRHGRQQSSAARGRCRGRRHGL